MKLLLVTVIGFVAVNAAYALRGKKINTWEQNGGDVEQLKIKQSRRPGALFNALKRTATTKWDNLKDSRGNYVVPYVISATNYNSEESRVIDGAMKAIERNTCIRYKKRSSEKDYLNIVSKPGDGCYTFVGRLGGSAKIQLEAGDRQTCMTHDIVIHELLHSLGLWHEQMRYDRDNYIKVHYENIAPGADTQFTTVDSEKSTTYGEPYDFRSVMHYPKDAFGKRHGLITMETKQKQFANIIGKAKTASPADYRKICNVYQCQTCPGGGSSGRTSVPAPAPSAPAPSAPSAGCKDRGIDFCNKAFCDNSNYSASSKKRLCAKTCNLC